MAIHIKTDGTATSVALPSDDTRLRTMQALVGGHIQLIGLPPGEKYAYMVMDEEGRLKDALPNPTATRMIEDMGGVLVAPIVGDVLLLKADEID